MSTYPQVPQQISDPISENLTKLRELFPSAVKDGALDVEALRAELGDFEEIKPGDETYELNWVGKQAAKKEAFKPLLGKTLALKNDGKNSETTQNLYIEGDNLEALKLLRQNYYGEVKLIYIDPPYNTGKDFVYKDNFTTKSEESEQEEGAISIDGQRLIKNEKSSNRFHARWLDMIYPRLKLAKDLLREDGVILISIDDNEAPNLRVLCDEIFGEANTIAQLIWEKGRKNDAKLFSAGHEYIVVYAKSAAKLRELKQVWREEKPGAREIWDEYLRLRQIHGAADSKIESDLAQWFSSLPRANPSKKWSRYKRIDKNGPWRDRDISWPGGDGPTYDVFHPVTKQPCAVPERGWIYSSPDEMERQIKLGLVEFRKDHTEPPFRKAHIRPVPEEVESESDNPDDDDSESELATQVRGTYFYKQSQVSVKHLRKLMGAKVFTNPKDHEELAKLIEYVTPNDRQALIIDFFAGSGSTAEAVFTANATFGSNHRFIMVQLPESLEAMKASVTGTAKKTVEAAIRMLNKLDRPLLLPEISKERIRRAGDKIRVELKTKCAELQKKQAIESRTGNKLPLDEDSESPEEPNSYILNPDSLDIGFKSFRIEDTKINWLKKDLRGEDIIAEAGLTTQDALDFVPGFTDTDVVYELMLRQSNIPLTGAITLPAGTGKRTYLYADAYLICLEKEITKELVEALAAIEPTPNKYFFRDSAFGKDIALKDETFRRLKAEIHKHHGDLGTAYTVEFI